MGALLPEEDRAKLGALGAKVSRAASAWVYGLAEEAVRHMTHGVCYTNLCMHMYITDQQRHVYTYIYTHLYMYIYIYVYMCVYTYVCM